MKKAEELTPDEWRAGIAFNLDGTFFCSVAAFKVMKEQKSGKIINISSVAGMKDSPSFPHYGASKAGVINLTRTLAAGWAPHNIHVNCIAPGLTATESLRKAGWLPPETNKDGTPVPQLLRPIEPENVAALAVFLGAEASDNLTGEIIPIRASFAGDR